MNLATHRAWQSESVQRRPTLSLNEWAVLGVIVDKARHGYDIASELSPGRPVGDAWKLSRQLVYRAIERLEALGLAEPRRTEPGHAAPPRTVIGPTRRGRTAMARWLDTPVEHLRDVRSELLLKLVLAEHLGHDRRTLVRAQQLAFADLFAGLDRREPDGGIVSTWRRNSARAVRVFLDDLS